MCPEMFLVFLLSNDFLYFLLYDFLYFCREQSLTKL